MTAETRSQNDPAGRGAPKKTLKCHERTLFSCRMSCCVFRDECALVLDQFGLSCARVDEASLDERLNAARQVRHKIYKNALKLSHHVSILNRNQVFKQAVDSINGT